MKYFLILIFLTISTLSVGQNLKVKKIEFSTDGYANEPDFDLTIYDDRIIIFNARTDNYKEKVIGEVIPFGRDSNGVDIQETEIKGIFKTKINRKTFKEISDLINSLENEFVTKNYPAKSIHHSIGYLKVVFSNCESKSIYDGDLSGTKQLIKIYNYFNKLRFNLKWK
jgi:hypothetical protein